MNRNTVMQPPTESAEQKALFEWWRLAGRREAGAHPSVLMFAIPNGGQRRAVTGARLKGEGALAGVPDVFLAWPSRGKAGMWIELKRRRGGRLSDAQRDVLARLEEAGYEVAVCHGWLEARDAILAYLQSEGHGEGRGALAAEAVPAGGVTEAGGGASGFRAMKAEVPPVEIAPPFRSVRKLQDGRVPKQEHAREAAGSEAVLEGLDLRPG